MSVMQNCFLHGITHACVLIHIEGSIVKSLTVVIQVVTPVRVVPHVKTLLMVWLIVLTVLAHQDMMESSVVTILMNVLPVLAKMVDFVLITLIVIHVCAKQILKESTVKLLFGTFAHLNRVLTVEHARGQEKREETIPAFVLQILQDETALLT